MRKIETKTERKLSYKSSTYTCTLQKIIFDTSTINASLFSWNITWYIKNSLVNMRGVHIWKLINIAFYESIEDFWCIQIKVFRIIRNTHSIDLLFRLRNRHQAYFKQFYCREQNAVVKPDGIMTSLPTSLSHLLHLLLYLVGVTGVNWLLII